jgi:DNA-directed RNA polymerase subunit E'/Rpb7
MIMSRIVIEKRVSIKPFALDSNLQEHLYSKICEEMLEKCDSTNGYIMKIYKNIKILENSVSSASPNVFFLIQFTAKVMKPEVGSTYTGTVCMVFSHGIFVEVGEKMKVLVPTNKLKEYTFVPGKNMFKKGSVVICQGDKLDVSIDMIKYEKHNFNCIGNLKNLTSK